MTDNFAGFIWIACLIFIGAMICLLCCGICDSERHETLVVSSHIPDCLSSLNFEINGQLEDDKTASWIIGACFHQTLKKEWQRLYFHKILKYEFDIGIISRMAHCYIYCYMDGFILIEKLDVIGVLSHIKRSLESHAKQDPLNAEVQQVTQLFHMLSILFIGLQSIMMINGSEIISICSFANMNESVISNAFILVI